MSYESTPSLIYLYLVIIGSVFVSASNLTTLNLLDNLDLKKETI